jgi:hypothetical protein
MIHLAQKDSNEQVTHLGNGVYMVRVDSTYAEEKAVEVARLQANLDWKDQLIKAGFRLKKYFAEEVHHAPKAEQETDKYKSKERNFAHVIMDFLGVLFFVLAVLYMVLMLLGLGSSQKSE